MSAEGEAKQTRIYWEANEIDSVARKAFELYLRDNTNLWTFVDEAQQVLPTDRHRTIMGRASVSSALCEKFDEIREEFLAEATAPPIEIQIEKVVKISAPRSEILASITTDELLILLAKRLAPIMDSLSARPAIEKAVHPVQQVSTTESDSEAIDSKLESKKRFPKVLILEFLPGQEEEIRKKASGFELELIFGGKARRESVPPSCHWCVINKKVSHSTFNRTKEQVGNGHIFVVSGIEAAVKKLADINSRAHRPQGA